MDETLGGSYRIRTTLPASAHFSNPTPRNTKELPFDVRGNQPNRRASAQNLFGTPVEPQVQEGSGTDEQGFQNYSGESRLPEFNHGAMSGKETQPETSDHGLNLSMPAKTSLPEAGEETSAMGDVAGIAEALL